MTDRIENELAEGIEQDLGIKAMAAKLAPRSNQEIASDQARAMKSPSALNAPYAPLVQGETVEQKLQAIERLVREIRATSAQVKGMLG